MVHSMMFATISLDSREWIEALDPLCHKLGVLEYKQHQGIDRQKHTLHSIQRIRVVCVSRVRAPSSEGWDGAFADHHGQRTWPAPLLPIS